MKQKNRMNKKGIALNQAFGAILTLILVAVLVIIALVLFASVNTSFAGTSSASAQDESITVPASVAGTSNCSFGEFILVTATNGSGTLISSANYTTTAAGLITNITTQASKTAAPWIVNYTYTWGSQACTAGDNMITQFATYPVLIGLVGTIIFLGLVIGVLVASFVFGSRKGV